MSPRWESDRARETASGRELAQWNHCAHGGTRGWQARALKVTLEHRIGIKVPSDARILYMPAKPAGGGIRDPRFPGVFVGRTCRVKQVPSPSKAWQSKHVPNIRRVPKSSDSEHSRGLQIEVTAHSISKSAWRDPLRLPLVPQMRY